MPHVSIWTCFRKIHKGPTYISTADALLLQTLSVREAPGATFTGPSKELFIELPVHTILDRMQNMGFSVNGFTKFKHRHAARKDVYFMWTLQKPNHQPNLI
ncbi:hypothetical protein HDE_04385 [Halotydeus destructor]|nr:hypothetical protein HDE_04385 [Halotydeus destructor]